MVRERLSELGYTVWFVIIAIIAMFLLGGAGLVYKKIIGKESANIQREIFKENKSYVEGMASDLAKYKYELATEKDEIARKAIVDLIIDKYGNFDISKLEDASLQRFLIDVRNGKYNKMGDK